MNHLPATNLRTYTARCKYVWDEKPERTHAHSKVQLESSDDSYAKAKKFTARAGLLSRKEASGYFGMHPASQINDPVIKAQKFDRSLPIEHQHGYAGLGAAAGAGA